MEEEERSGLVVLTFHQLNSGGGSPFTLIRHTVIRFTCQEVSGGVRRWQEVSGDVRRCQELSGGVRRCQEMLGGARRCQEVSGDVELMVVTVSSWW